jgi:hypothetical protein
LYYTLHRMPGMCYQSLATLAVVGQQANCAPKELLLVAGANRRPLILCCFLRRRCIFCRYEGVSPAGSHKPNTAVPQAYYNKLEGEGKLLLSRMALCAEPSPTSLELCCA